MGDSCHKEYKENITYIYYLTKPVNEGGTARNNAFYEAFKDLKADMFNVYTKYTIVRFFITFKAILVLFFIKNKTVFIHQGTLFFIFSMILLRVAFFRKIIFYFLNRVSYNNKLVIEINDLIYEQSIDLELVVDEIFSILQVNIFSIDQCNYVFASNAMESYVVSKYAIDSSKSSVILNGAPKVQDYSFIVKNQQWMNSNKNKFVYAGSLNRGRQIEELLNIFRSKKNELLVILGSGGEWINDIILPENIIYMGNYEERAAHYIVSKCDIGIIPYNADRFYYNMCYPTKASFYITAGLPVLSTPLKELQNIFSDKGVFLFSDFEDWDKVIEGIDNTVILKLKKEVDIIKERFYWESLLFNLKY